MKDIEDLRKEIDELDDKIAALYEKRLCLCADIGRIKKEKKTAVESKSREKQITDRLTSGRTDMFAERLGRLYSFIFQESKDFQRSSFVGASSDSRPLSSFYNRSSVGASSKSSRSTNSASASSVSKEENKVAGNQGEVGEPREKE